MILETMLKILKLCREFLLTKPQIWNID